MKAWVGKQLATLSRVIGGITEALSPISPKAVTGVDLQSPGRSVGTGERVVAQGLATLGAFGGGGSSNEVTTLFRAVDATELAAMGKAGGKLVTGGASMEGKFFAETAADAAKWGELLNAPHILQVTVPTTAANAMKRWDRLDGIGAARYAEMDQLVNAVVEILR